MTLLPTHHPRKRFGQHFLHDSQVLQDIYYAIQPNEKDHMVEIGPGHGELTELLSDKVARLDLIEIDRDLVQILRHRFISTASILMIHEGDALTFNLSQLTQQPQSLRIIGNLPYNISTPLLFRLFSQLNWIIDMHFMLQKEVVQRLTAKVGSSGYNRLSVMSQYFCDNTELLLVPPSAFDPPPKVDSAIIRMLPIANRKIDALNLDHFSLIVREAFSHRRKTLSNALSKWISAPQLEALEINPKIRPQEVSVEGFVRISNQLFANS